jgi:hypothetical protein
MAMRRTPQIGILIGALTAATSAVGAGIECPVTLPRDWPVRDVPMGQSGDRAWYGSELLAALVPIDGKWIGMGPERAYRDKFWWWRRGFDARAEWQPDLVISAVRLDGPASHFELTRVTTGYDDEWDAMLVGMEFPSAGCWEVRATYNGVQELTVVLQVGTQ